MNFPPGTSDPSANYADNLGSWKNDGTKTSHYSTSHKVSKQIKLNPSSEEQANVLVNRYLYVYPKTPSFKRIVVTVSTRVNNKLSGMEQWDLKSPVFVQYYFADGRKPIAVPAHGNSKKRKPYFRTKESTKLRIKEKLPDAKNERCKSKTIFSHLVEERGGVTKIKSPADVPRDRTQISNFHKNSELKENDDLTTVILLSKEEFKSGNPFIREVIAAPELKIFLCNNQQLADIRRFCCNPNKAGILGVDMTFNCGEFFVTITVYRHKMLVTDHGNEPCFIGPVLIHQSKSFESYFGLPSLMVKYSPELKNLQAMGTDGETALINAFKCIFTTALHLLCDLHMKENIEHHLNSLNVDSFLLRKIVFGVFGRRVGSVKIKGLVDCTTEEEFTVSRNNLINEWRNMDVPEEFITYFMGKSALISQTMTADVRARAGLGSPPDMYRQQGNESINNMIKKDMVKKMTILQFINHLRHIVEQQQSEVEMAIYGRGVYEMKEEYRATYAVDEGTWYRKSEPQKEHCIEKFNNAPVIGPNHNSKVIL